ncbi:similar to Saccharomyces cerevisiae YHR061C GIC1 Protein of unknown function involved in initiation of budding and cellular polarization [Maudiozyma barnettii]|uniref:CRIB domain-containing protein n=1 Tax=Maudiozyma barnettii TaxID=61262 RepID=A0A8H2ZEB5_9SACH|nr:uncharacterized protein KABA2_01S06732 [Kazachstania barnettii]CAB4252131.1 similar to Saccharomyces cerevisiae YHR061C GIC1 Protein of unknown function involved in initiation of budding and cellular polarization [Kazachstania barnettii]CAD1778679.1 similar to Saccharomyces cerevisiae YHR061C GIC1 Protein of unknown function involved in initiation of budding and cellular polarization [Kazachstania barnettii]
MNQNNTMESRIPHISSIWLDEDEDSEKLYNFQSEKFLRDDEEDGSLKIYMMDNNEVNKSIRTVPVSPLSEKVPTFPSSLTGSNKKRFSLYRYPSPENDILTTDTSNITRSNSSKSVSSNLTSLRGKLLGKLKKKWNNNVVSSEKKKEVISTPFNFQHIFHANLDAAMGSDCIPKKNAILDTENDLDEITEVSSNIYNGSSIGFSEIPESPITFGKAYCTEEIKSFEFDRDYRRVRNSDTTNMSFEMENCLNFSSYDTTV